MDKLTNSKAEILNFEISPTLPPYPTVDKPKLQRHRQDDVKRWKKKYQKSAKQSKLMSLYLCKINRPQGQKRHY